MVDGSKDDDPDPFIDVWGEVQKLLEDNAGLEAKTVFEFLQRLPDKHVVRTPLHVSSGSGFPGN